MNPISEKRDKIKFAAQAEWRCHQCYVLVSVRSLLRERGEQLLCAACYEEEVVNHHDH